MIDLSNIEAREHFWNKTFILPKLSQSLVKRNYRIGSMTRDKFVISGKVDVDMLVVKSYPNNWGEASITVKFRPNRNKYHYSLDTQSGSYALSKESRRFRYKAPGLDELTDAIEYLYRKLTEEKSVSEKSREEKEQLHRRRLMEANDMARAIGATIDANVNYGTFKFQFKTLDGTEIKMSFHIHENGDISDFDVDGRIKKHHFYSLVDSLRKSVPDITGGGIVKKRRFDLSSDIITRIAKNDKITKQQYSKIRSWRRNFNLEGKK